MFSINKSILSYTINNVTEEEKVGYLPGYVRLIDFVEFILLNL